MKKLKFQRPLISTVAFEEMFINGKSKEFGQTCLYYQCKIVVKVIDVVIVVADVIR